MTVILEKQTHRMFGETAGLCGEYISLRVWPERWPSREQLLAFSSVVEVTTHPSSLKECRG